MMHARTKDAQTPLATERVIADQIDSGILADERLDDPLGQ